MENSVKKLKQFGVRSKMYTSNEGWLTDEVSFDVVFGKKMRKLSSQNHSTFLQNFLGPFSGNLNEMEFIYVEFG